MNNKKKVGSFTALNLRRNIKKFDELEMTSVRDGHLILFHVATSQQQTTETLNFKPNN